MSVMRYILWNETDIMVNFMWRHSTILIQSSSAKNHFPYLNNCRYAGRLSINQGCRFFRLLSEFWLFQTFRLFFFFPLLSFVPPVHVLYTCVTTMRVNWWLSGQFWLRKALASRGLRPLQPPPGRCPWTPLGLCPQTPRPTIISYFF